MPKPVYLHDKKEIESFFRHNTLLHIFAVGDLDDFFWPYTTWYALRVSETIREIALFYSGTSMPTLVGITDGPDENMRTLLESILHILPGRFYSHLNEGFSDIFKRKYKVDSHGLYYKMGLTDTSKCTGVDSSGLVKLTESDVSELKELYDTSYPGHWFEPYMLKTGHYYGIREENRLVSAAGVHVYSAEYRVAALGNITTHPDHRGKGLATIACAELCRSLLRTVDHIGLNVKTDNVTAITCYEKLGFEVIATYEECMLELDIGRHF
jgi:GNAT superfamily N-acetyltransferase